MNVRARGFAWVAIGAAWLLAMWCTPGAADLDAPAAGGIGAASEVVGVTTTSVPDAAEAVAGEAAVATAVVTATAVGSEPVGMRPDAANVAVCAANGPCVVVVDDAGAALAGAIVVTVAGEHDLATRVTDAAGVAHVAAAAMAVRVEAAAHWPTTTGLAANGTTRVALQRAPMLRGRVFTAAGEPRAGARVALLPALAGRRGWPPLLQIHDGIVSDARGAFAVAWPSPKPHDLVVAVDGVAPHVSGGLRPETCGEPTIVLLPGAALRGALRGAGACVGQTIELWSVDADRSPAAPAFGPGAPWLGGQCVARGTTAADGSFAFTDLPPGAGWVVAPASAAQRRVLLAAGAAVVVDLVLPGTLTVRGVVQGNAASSSNVFLFGGGPWSQCVRTDANGAFAFAPTPAGRYLVGATPGAATEAMHAAVQRRLVEADGVPVGDGAVVVARAEAALVELVLPAMPPAFGTIRGRAFRGGAPAAGDAIVACAVPSVGARQRHAEVGADGAFTLATLVPGDYELLWTRGGVEVARTPCRVPVGAVTLTLTRP